MADDFTKPGNDDGHIPSPYDKAEPSTHVQNGDVFGPGSSRLPSPLQCGKRYELFVRSVRNGVAHDERASVCTDMYRDALDLLNARAAKLDCPKTCQPLHTWVAARRWELEPGQADITLRIHLGILCPALGLGPPDDQDFQNWNGYKEDDLSLTTDHTPQGHDWWTIEGLGRSIRCGDRRLIKVTYLADVDTCDDLNFADKVATARKVAEFYVDQVTCRSVRIQTSEGNKWIDCGRKATRLRTEWTCAKVGGTDNARCQVQVDVYWAVRCVTPTL
jgi:hypothetical protein